MLPHTSWRLVIRIGAYYGDYDFDDSYANGNNNNNNDKPAYAGATGSFRFTHLKVLLVLIDRGILAQSN